MLGSFATQKSPGQTLTPDAKAKKQNAVTDSLVIIARLTEIPGKFPTNDVYNYVYIMKYRVVKVLKGTYQGQDILIGQYNPRIARKLVKDKMDPFVNGDVSTFTVGDLQRLVLVLPMDNVWKDAVEDEYFDSDQPKFYAVSSDKVK
jgi:hypothetical protein